MADFDALELDLMRGEEYKPPMTYYPSYEEQLEIDKERAEAKKEEDKRVRHWALEHLGIDADYYLGLSVREKAIFLHGYFCRMYVHEMNEDEK